MLMNRLDRAFSGFALAKGGPTNRNRGRPRASADTNTPKNDETPNKSQTPPTDTAKNSQAGDDQSMVSDNVLAKAWGGGAFISTGGHTPKLTIDPNEVTEGRAQAEEWFQRVNGDNPEWTNSAKRAEQWSASGQSVPPPAFFQAAMPPSMWRAVTMPASCAACTAIADRSPKAQ